MKKYILLPALFGILVLSQGCAVAFLGKAIGKKIDKGNFEEGPGSKIKVVDPDQLDWGGSNLVEIHMTDSTVYTGSFLGYHLMDLEKYQLEYDDFKDAFSPVCELPEIGAILSIVKSKKADRIYMGRFEGFTLQGIRMRKKNISMNYNMDKIGLLMDADGNTYDVQAIRDHYYALVIPNRSVVSLRLKGGELISIRVNDIAYGRCQRNDRKGEIVGFLVGGVIDVTYFALLTYAVISFFYQWTH